MSVEVVPVLEEEKTILARLIELYEYDFSEFDNKDVNALGLFGYAYLDYYWTEDRRFPYFIKVDGKLAGLAMICDFCYVSKDRETSFMAEFFVMRKYRKLGVGTAAAKKVFSMHKGKWELTLHPQNLVALKFWRNVIEACVGDNYKTFHDIRGVYDDALAIAYTFEIS